MFIIIAGVILIISFVIALISLIREQKKLNKITSDEEHGVTAEKPTSGLVQPDNQAVPGATSAPTTEEPEIKTEFSVAAPPKQEAKQSPFPWEEQTQTTATNAVVENTLETPIVKPQDESFILHPKRASTGLSLKSDDLRETVSLKDLADKS